MDISLKILLITEDQCSTKRKTVQQGLLMSADIVPWPQGKTQANSWMSINGPLTSTGLNAREQQQQGCSMGENETDAEGDTRPHWQRTNPQNLSRARVVTGPSTTCNGRTGPGLFRELQRETKLERSYQHLRFGVIQEGQLEAGQQETGLGSGTPET